MSPPLSEIAAAAATRILRRPPALRGRQNAHRPGRLHLTGQVAMQLGPKLCARPQRELARLCTASSHNTQYSQSAALQEWLLVCHRRSSRLHAVPEPPASPKRVCAQTDTEPNSTLCTTCAPLLQLPIHPSRLFSAGCKLQFEISLQQSPSWAASCLQLCLTRQECCQQRRVLEVCQAGDLIGVDGRGGRRIEVVSSL